MPTIQELREAGFSDQEIGQWAEGERAQLREAGFNDNEISDSLTGIKLPEKVPEALIDRIMAGKELNQVFNKVGAIFDMLPPQQIARGLSKGVATDDEPAKAAGLIDALANLPTDVGWFVGRQLKHMYEGIPTPETTKKIGEGLATPEEIVNTALSVLWGSAVTRLPGGIAKIKPGPHGTVEPVTIGELPKHMDFVDGATVVGDGTGMPHVEQKLLEAYTEKGIHPAEVVDDVRTDPTIKQDMLSVNPGLPEKYVGPYKEAAIFPPETTRTEMVLEPQAGEGGRGGGPPRIEGPVIDNEGVPRRIEGPARVEPMTLDDATNKILDHISIGERTPRRGLSFSRLYTGFIDDMNPIKKLEREFVPEGLPIEESPYVAYRMLSGSVTQAHDMIMGAGVPDFAQLYKKGVKPDEVPTVAQPLNKIMEPVRNAEELDKFRAFAAAARTIELERRGIETGFDLEAARVVARGYADKYTQTLAELIDFQNKVSAALVESGIISRRARAGLLSQNLIYTPFYRVLEPQPKTVGGRTLQPQNPLHAIQGSEKQIIDPLESIIKNTYLYNQMANRNLAARSLADFMDRIGLGEKKEVGMIPTLAPEHPGDLSAWLEHYGTPKATADEFAVFIQTAMEPAGMDAKLSVFRNGRKFLYDVDPEVARAVQGLDKETASTLVKIMGQWTSVLRAGALLVPEFGARHLMRDYFYALVTSPGGFSPLNMVRGLMHQIKQDKLFHDWTRSGSANVTMMAFDRRWLQEDLRKLTQDTGLMTRAWNVVASPEMSVGQKAGISLRAMIHPLQVWMEIAQSATHVGAFEKALNRGKSMREAGWESRETSVDVARKGAWTQSWNMVSAFANATIQDTDRWIRELSPRDPKKAAGAAFKIAAGITAPSVLLWAANHDDADFKEIPQWEKDIFWHIGMGQTAPSPAQIAQAQARGEEPKASVWAWARVPKPFGLGVIFGSGAERTLDALYAEKPEAFKGFLESLYENIVPGVVPTPVAPIAEQWANKDMFTGRPLIPQSLKDQLPEYQYTNYTTELTKSLGRLLEPFHEGGVSPIRIESLVRGWTSQSGVYIMNIIDAGLRKAGIVPDPPTPDYQLADIPFVRAFVSRYPSATTQSIEEFHKEFERRNTLFKTLMAQAQAGDAEAVKHVAELGGAATFVRLEGLNRALGIMGKSARGIYKNPDIPGAEKRQLIDSIYGQMSVMARRGNEIFQATKR